MFKFSDLNLNQDNLVILKLLQKKIYGKKVEIMVVYLKKFYRKIKAF